MHQGLMGVGDLSGTAAVELDVSLYCEKDNAEMAPSVLFGPGTARTGLSEDCVESV